MCTVFHDYRATHRPLTSSKSALYTGLPQATPAMMLKYRSFQEELSFENWDSRRVLRQLEANVVTYRFSYKTKFYVSLGRHLSDSFLLARSFSTSTTSSEVPTEYFVRNLETQKENEIEWNKQTQQKCVSVWLCVCARARARTRLRTHTRQKHTSHLCGYMWSKKYLTACHKA